MCLGERNRFKDLGNNQKAKNGFTWEETGWELCWQVSAQPQWKSWKAEIFINRHVDHHFLERKFCFILKRLAHHSASFIINKTCPNSSTLSNPTCHDSHATRKTCWQLPNLSDSSVSPFVWRSRSIWALKYLERLGPVSNAYLLQKVN